MYLLPLLKATNVNSSDTLHDIGNTHGNSEKHNTYKKQHFSVHHAQSINHLDNIYTNTIITLIKAFLLELLF